MQGIFGPCQITQLLDIGLQELLSKLSGFISLLVILIYKILLTYTISRTTISRLWINGW
jgi:hypothetical protein